MKIFYGLIAFLLIFSHNAISQCTNTSSYGGGTAPTSGDSLTMSTCNYASEYTTVTGVAAATDYQVTSSISTDYITVRQGSSGGTVIASGVQPLNWTSTVAGTYYIHINTDASCGTQSSCRTTKLYNILPSTPMVYVSSTTTQTITTDVSPGSTSQQVIGLEVITSGTTSPIDLTQIIARTNGTTSNSDISNAKLWYTGTSSTFATTSQFGSTIASPPSSGVNMTFSGTQTLSAGTNYFWLTYDVQSGATLGNVIDGTLQQITVDGSVETPTTSAPTGNRQIAETPDVPWPGQDLGTLSCPYNNTWINSTVGSNNDCSYYSTGGDHIYQFTTTIQSDVTISLCGSSFDTYLMLYDISSGGCGSAPLASNDDFCSTQSEITETSLAAGTYVIVIEGYSGATGDYTLSIDVSNCANSGDTPCDAISLTVGCSGSKVSCNNSGATDSGESSPSCGSYAGGDIWCVATVPASGAIQIETYNNTLTDIGMAVYTTSSDCSGTLTEIACDDNSGFGNMPKLTLSGLTPGDSLYIRTWDNNNDETGSYDIDAADLANNYCVTGNSIDEGGGCAQLTAETTNQLGSIWDANDKLDFASDWTYDFTVNLGSNDGGADGIAFVIQNDPAGLGAYGAAGGSLGAGGITNSLIIEIDTYLNTEDRNDGLTSIDCISSSPDPDHLDIWLNGVINPGNCSSGARIIPNAVELTNGGSLYNIENGLDHVFRVSYTSATQTITASILNSSGTITYGTVSYSPVDPSNLFGTNYPYFGFTGSTGGLDNLQTACLAADFVILPIELSKFDVACDGNNISINWATESETNNDYFNIERSNDATTWKTISTINGAGNSINEKEYRYIDYEHPDGDLYYRLKQVDFDGHFTYSKIKATNCNNSNEFSVTIYSDMDKNNTYVHFSQPTESSYKLDVINSLGVTVQRYTIPKGVTNYSVPRNKNIQMGVYVYSIYNNSEQYVEKHLNY